MTRHFPPRHHRHNPHTAILDRGLATIDREKPMHTKDQLAAALREVGLDAMADKAATGYYHDFLSPLDLPEMQLAHDLAQAMNQNPRQSGEIGALRRRVINGDFDASAEESDAWSESEEGQEAMRYLERKIDGK
jgi:predicted short-subunit dehydrogenase-like oxidoreductase (DUF2520 family)